MNYQITENDVLQRVLEYAAAKGWAESTAGKRMVNDGKICAALREGKTITLKTLRRIDQYITDNPPTEASDSACCDPSGPQRG